MWRVVGLTVNLSGKSHPESGQHHFMGWTLNFMRRKEPTALASSLLLLRNTMTKNTYRRKVDRGFQLQRVRVHDNHGGENGSRQTGMAL